MSGEGWEEGGGGGGASEEDKRVPTLKVKLGSDSEVKKGDANSSVGGVKHKLFSQSSKSSDVSDRLT